METLHSPDIQSLLNSPETNFDTLFAVADTAGEMVLTVIEKLYVLSKNSKQSFDLLSKAKELLGEETHKVLMEKICAKAFALLGKGHRADYQQLLQ